MQFPFHQWRNGSYQGKFMLRCSKLVFILFCKWPPFFHQFNALCNIFSSAKVLTWKNLKILSNTPPQNEIFILHLNYFILLLFYRFNSLHYLDTFPASDKGRFAKLPLCNQFQSSTTHDYCLVSLRRLKWVVEH